MKIKLSYITSYCKKNYQRGFVSSVPLLITALSLIVPLVTGQINKDGEQSTRSVLATTTSTKVVACLRSYSSGTAVNGYIYFDSSQVSTGSSGCYSSTVRSGTYLAITASAQGYIGSTQYITASGVTQYVTFYLRSNYVVPTRIPTKIPTKVPTKIPTKVPTRIPTKIPSGCVVNPLLCATPIPTKKPTPTPIPKVIISYKVNGTVKDKMGAPISGAIVTTTVSNNGISSTTNSNGSYSMTLPSTSNPYNVTLRASKTDFNVSLSPALSISAYTPSKTHNFTLIKQDTTTGRITGYVWIDSNNNKLMETDEQLGSVRVGVSDRNEFGTTSTSTKLYSITLPINRAYTVSAVSGAYTGSRTVTLSTSQASGINIQLKKPSTVTPTPTPRGIGKITGVVSLDNGNGSRPYIGENVRVTLGIDKSASTFTSSTGSYSFSDLKANGNYSVKIEPATTYEVISQNPVSPVHPPANINSAEIVNFRIRLRSTTSPKDNIIKGVAYHDNNNNAIQDKGDIVFQNIQINLGGTLSRSIKTGTNGSYEFTGLPAGDYTIRPSVPGGYKASHDWPNGQVGGSTKSITRNFGIVYVITPSPVKSKTITGHLFFDKNGNGKADENPETGERDGGAGFNAMTVKITGEGISSTTKTSRGSITNGDYNFTEIKPGSYAVTLQTIPSGFSLTTAQSQTVTVDSTNVASKPVNFLLKKTTTTTPGPCIANSALCITPSLSKKVTGKILTSNKSLYTGTVALVLKNTRTGSTANRSTSTGSFSFDNLSTTKETYTLLATTTGSTSISSTNPLTLTVDAGQTYAATFTVSTPTTSPAPSLDPVPTGVTPKVTTSPAPVTPRPSTSVTLSPAPTITTPPVCLQVITYARNSSTNVCQTFPNSCIPAGWVKDQSCAQTTPTVTIAPTVTSAPTITAVPTVTSAPTATPVPNATRLSFTILLHGIGNSGDSTNPNQSSLSNKNPIHPQRPLTIIVFDSAGTSVLTKDGLIGYDAAGGNFKGIIDLGTTLPSGQYTLKIKTPQYLKRQIPGILTIKAGQVQELAPITLTAGDITGDNSLSILDYNVLVGCYSDFEPPVSCSGTQSRDSDLNDDNKVNQIDYNLFLRNLSLQYGD